MTAATTTDTSTGAPTVGKPQELGRYTTATGTERVLRGQRVDGIVVITDYDPAGGARAYLLEQGLEQEGRGANAALKALIADYLLCRRRHRAYYADPFDMPIVDGEVLRLPRS